MPEEGRPGTQRLVVEADMDAAEELVLASGEGSLFSARAPGRSGTNEDAAGVFPVDAERLVLAVADGMGGRPGGESAARITLQSLADHLGRVPAGEESLRGAILDAVEESNRAILALGLGAAATLGIVEVQGRRVRSYHVGDAVILVTGQRGRIKLQTVPHSPVGYAVEAGVLDEEEALHHEERHLISNAVGSADMRIEVGSPLRLASRDTVLLATDGLFDNLGMPEIVDLVRAGPLPKAARQLAEQARIRMSQPETGAPSKPDDLTYVLFRPRAPSEPR